MTYFAHPQALVESDDVGEGTRVWAFAHVLPGARIGRDCNICDGVFIENDVVVGDRVTIKCGVQLWDGIRVADDVFIGPNATFTNDRYPRSRQYPPEFARTEVGAGASLGANCTILPGIRIGRRAMVGAGSVVTKDVPPNAVVVGNPARIVGYEGSDAEPAPAQESGRPATSAATSVVPGVQLLDLTRANDLRGSLMAVELDGKDLPFRPSRIFTVFDVPTRDVRGAHAHRTCHQVLVCVAGTVRAVVDNGRERQAFLLDSPDVGLYVPPMIWGTQYNYSPNAVLMVFASHPYDADDYIRDYDEFLDLVTGT